MSAQGNYLTEIAGSQIAGKPTELAKIKRYMAGEWAPGVNWCAGFLVWCLLTAGYAAPAAGAPRRGARALAKWLASENGWVIAPPACNPDLSVLRPGDIVCWRRVRFGWQCHVAIIEDVGVMGPLGPTVIVVGGNESGQVRRSWLSLPSFRERLYGLYGVARPQRVVA